jgi:hypothetical protein
MYSESKRTKKVMDKYREIKSDKNCNILWFYHPTKKITYFHKDIESKLKKI